MNADERNAMGRAQRATLTLKEDKKWQQTCCRRITFATARVRTLGDFCEKNRALTSRETLINPKFIRNDCVKLNKLGFMNARSLARESAATADA